MDHVNMGDVVAAAASAAVSEACSTTTTSLGLAGVSEYLCGNPNVLSLLNGSVALGGGFDGAAHAHGARSLLADNETSAAPECVSLYCPSVYKDVGILERGGIFLLFVLIAWMVQWFVLSRVQWKFRDIPYWVAGLHWQPVSMFSSLATPAILLTMAVVALPFLMSLGFSAYLSTEVQVFYVDKRSPFMMGFAVAAGSLSVLVGIMGYLQFQNSRYQISNTVLTYLSLAFSAAFITFGTYYCIAYAGIPFRVSGASFIGVATVFMMMNLWPLIMIQFDNAGSGMPINYAKFLKSRHKYDAASFVVRVHGAGYALADGVYHKQDAVSDSAPIYQHEEHPNMVIKRVRYVVGWCLCCSACACLSGHVACELLW